MSAPTARRIPERVADGVAAAPPEVVELSRLKAKVDVGMLVARGWDCAERVFAPPADDPLFGYQGCERQGCVRAGSYDRSQALGLCDQCARNYLARLRGYRSSPLTLEQFKAMPMLRLAQAEREEELCLVCRTPGHERAARLEGLCGECSRMRHARGQTVEAFVAGDDRYPPAWPRRGFGRCMVHGCRRWAITDERLCPACRKRWHKLPADTRPSIEQFAAQGPWQPTLDGRRAVMPELPELVEWQLLAGLQLLIEPYALITAPDQLAVAWAAVASAGVGSIQELEKLPGSYPARRVVEVAIIAARRLASSPEEERTRDVWDLGVFGIREHGTLRFTHIRQRWLRETAKGYAVERMAKVSMLTTQRDVGWMGYLSDYLDAREDRGEQPSALTREDMTGFLSWLQARVPSRSRRHTVVSSVRRHVLFARRHLAGPGQPAEGIGGGFQLYHEDLPFRSERDPDEPGRALPRTVLAQLLDEELLGLLDAQYHEYRVAFELIAHTGRRPGEICHLPADCVRYDEEPGTDGGGKQRRAVLRYRREKPPSKWASLPINQDTADLIEAQQQRLRERFPEISFSKLPLLPRRRCNPTGRLAMESATLSNRVTKWVNRLPPLLDEDGSEFGREHVYLYALRHSYAQRHADAGVAIDTLQKLMDHRTTATTQIYYRVAWSRKREAIERVAPLTMDRAGHRTGFHAGLVEAERLREEIGRIPVPLGYCTEQHNVRALGAHCPFSHQCLGCEHFRTDPSHLPDLYAYLERLLETRERLRAAIPQLEEWAREKAIPADAEIKTVRTLIRAGEDALDELTAGERSKLLELFRVLRATRARMDGTVAIEQIAATRHPEPTFLPPAFTPLASVRAAKNEDAA